MIGDQLTSLEVAPFTILIGWDVKFYKCSEKVAQFCFLEPGPPFYVPRPDEFSEQGPPLYVPRADKKARRCFFISSRVSSP